MAPNLEAEYGTCMAAAGVPDAHAVDDAILAAMNKFPPGTASNPANPTAMPGWAAAVVAEKTIAAADWRCRGAEATRVVNASGDRLAAWANRNRAALDAVEAGWEAQATARDAARTAAKTATTR